MLAVPEHPDVRVTPETLATYVGTYELERDSSEFAVTLDGGQLWSQADGEDARVGPMVAISEVSFYSNRFGQVFDSITAEEIDFVTDAQGNATHLVAYLNGVGRRAVRR